MNRASRRAQIGKQNPMVEQLKIEKRIKKAMDEARDSGIEYTSIVYSVILLMVLSDKTDMSEDEIQRIKDEVVRAAESITKEYMTIPDVIKTLAEEHNYKLDTKKLLKYYPELEGFLNLNEENS